MPLHPLRICLLSGVLVLALSGCSWYMDKANAIGSYMPTYDDWFGDGEKKPQTPTSSSGNPYDYNTNNNGYNGYYGQQPPPPPRGVAVPPGYYPTERYAVPSPNQQMPMPQTGVPIPPGAEVSPDQGLKQYQMQQQMMQQQQQGYPGAAPYGAQPSPYGSPYGAQPAVPFTQPELVVPEPQQDFNYGDQSRLIDEQLPPQLPSGTVAPKKDEGMFSFIDDISDTVNGWFDGHKEKQPYPNLASVPPKLDYQSQREVLDDEAAALVTVRDAAIAEQQRIVAEAAADSATGELANPFLAAPSAGSAGPAVITPYAIQ